MLQPFLFSVMRDLNRSGLRLDATPSVDAYRRGENLVMHVDLPGVDEDSLSVEVQDRVLTISAERTYAPEPGDEVLLSERPFGRFTRQFRFREGIDADAISAEFDRGVLTLTLPMTAAAAAKVKVAVRSAGSVQ